MHGRVTNKNGFIAKELLHEEIEERIIDTAADSIDT